MDLFDKRVRELEEKIEKLRLRWKNATPQDRKDIEVEASNRKAELGVLKKVIARRK